MRIMRLLDLENNLWLPPPLHAVSTQWWPDELHVYSNNSGTGRSLQPGGYKAKKKILFVSWNGLKKNRVGRSVKKIFCRKCVFYACFLLIWSCEGGKNFRVGIILNKNLLG